MINQYTYYEVYDDFSEDGRGNQISVIGRFSTETIAQRFAIGNGNYGLTAKVREVSIVVCDSIEDIEDIEDYKEEERNTALAKLTDREKQLLGLA